ncbi:hypothetical protein V5799_016853, partial [Amblyomma americanum]
MRCDSALVSTARHAAACGPSELTTERRPRPVPTNSPVTHTPPTPKSELFCDGMMVAQNTAEAKTAETAKSLHAADFKTDPRARQKSHEKGAPSLIRDAKTNCARTPTAAADESGYLDIPGQRHLVHAHTTACASTSNQDRSRLASHVLETGKPPLETLMGSGIAERLTTFPPLVPVLFAMRHDVLSYQVAVVQQSTPVAMNTRKSELPGSGTPRRKKEKTTPEPADVAGAANNDADAGENSEASKKSKKTKGMIIAGFLFIALVAFLYLLYVLLDLEILVTSNPEATVPPSTETKAPEPGENITYCNSEFCSLEASYLKSLLSTKKGPCDNFYDYVCETWVTNRPVKGSGTGDVVSTDTLIQDRVLEHFESLLSMTNDTQVDVARALYSACLDRDQANKALAEVRDFYKKWQIGQWPREKTANASDVWIFAGQLVRDIGLDALVKVSVVPNPGGPPETIAELDKPRFIFSCKDASRQSVTRLFRMTLRDVASEISQRADLLEEVMTVFTRLGSAPLLPAVPDTDLSAVYVARLTNLDHGYRRFLGAVLSANVSYFDDIDATVVVKSSDYVRHYVATAVRELPARATLNYLGFLVLVKLAPFLPEKFRSLRQLFAKNTLGRTIDDAPGSTSLCLVAVDRVLPACFARLASSSDSRAADRIFERLRQLEDIYHHNLGYVSWVDDVRAVLARYQLKRRPVLKYGFLGDDCAPAGVEKGATPIAFYRDVASRQQARQLKP